MALNEPTADASLADSRACRRLGIAMAAMIKIIATTINSSISENPFVPFISISVALVTLSWGRYY
jgi:hypothetical protein